MRKRWKNKRPIAIVVSIAMVFSITVAPGAASARSAADGFAAGTAAISDIPEWAIDDGADGGATELGAQAAIPEKYDLRDDGLVTAVKSQNPQQTCWAFAGIAAAETSMLSASGATYDKESNNIDLSERHLAWFALHPVTEIDDPAQAGEGIATFDESPQAAYDAGGLPVYITTLFAQGVGPLPESEFPYRGVDDQGVSHLYTPPMSIEEFDADPQNATLKFIAAMENEGVPAGEETTVADIETWLRDKAYKEGKTYEKALAEMGKSVRNQILSTYYDKNEDWTIPETNAEGRSNRTMTPFAVIKDGNVLPTYWNDADKTDLNTDAIAIMKQELVNGHGVTITYKADKASPSDTGDSDYMNAENWAQYTFGREFPSHAVCIVGYDDGYSKENFTHDVFKKDEKGNRVVDGEGKYVVDPDSATLTTPPDDGAWIVKNSWGSQDGVLTDDLGNETGRGSYGVDDSGYFYLSYFDRTIERPETMTFSTSLMSGTNDFEVLQHDYMAAQYQFYTETSSEVMRSANVFEVPHDMELRGVSTRTSEENQRVTLAVYVMDDDATSPDDGELYRQVSRNFELAGFHRLDLEEPLTVPAGKKVSVVSTVSTLSPEGARSYSVSANQGFSRETVESLRQQGNNITVYSTAKVNKGESFLYRDGAWSDWSEYIDGLKIDGEKVIDALPIDNFSIKLYGAPVDSKPAAKTDISTAKVTVASATYNGGKAVTPKVTVALGGTELKASTDYTVSYDNNKNAGIAVAIVKGKGDYTGSAAKVFTIAKANNTMTVKAKAKVNKVKLSKLKKKAQVITKAKAFKVTKAKGAVTFKKTAGNKKITVSKAGKVTVNKGLAKGTYKVKVKVTAAGNANYKKGVKTVTLKVRVQGAAS